MNKRQKEVEKAKLEAEKRELNHLKAIYKKASEDISKKIAISDGKINVLLKDIDNLDDTQKSILQSQIYQKKFQENLKKQIDGFMQELEAKQYESVDAYLKAAYETGYIGTMYDIAGQGIPLVMPIDQKAAARAMTHDTKLSKRLYTKLGEDVNLLKKRVANNIARGIATADSYANIARNIAEGTNIGINRTMTIARTEGHRIQVLGAVDAQQKAKDAGADVVKQWDAALDGRTRPHHRQLDGQIRELDEPFEVDGMKPMYPSGFGKASEDINCRCALLQRARWALDDEELETLKKRAEFYGLDKTKDFNDYKKKYLTASTKSSELTNRRKERLAARNAAKNNTLPDFSTMSNAGLKNYAEKNLKTQFVDFTGVNNEYAADAVKVIAEFEQKFGGTLDSLKVKFGGLPKGVYAKFDDKTNTLILKKTGSKKAFEEAQKADNFRYKHKWKTDTPYYATETYTGTIWHELAHAIDISENQNLSRALSKTAELDSLSARISAYARTTQNVRATKRSEAWAENFAAYMEGGEMAKRVPKEIADMIEDYFKKTANTVSVSVSKTAKAFTPAKTVEEAEEYAKQFVKEKTWSGNGNVSYKGLSLESANKFNETLLNLYEQNDIHLLNNIQPMNFRQTIWKGSETTPMAYRSAGDGDLFFNPKIMKNAKSLDAYMEEGRKAFKTCAENIDKFKGTDRELIETYLKAGSSLVAETTDDAMKTIIEHEMGHHIQHSIIYNSEEMAKIVADGFEEYGVKISGYATKTKGEYIAESYAAFCNGKAELIDPKLKDIFENIRKTGRN